MIKEIIYRLTIKDKLKQIKKGSKSNIYHSRVNVKQALESMCFDEYHIDLAITQYEVCTIAINRFQFCIHNIIYKN